MTPDTDAALRAADDMHATICEEIERLMDADPGSPREAALKAWVAVADAYDAVRWPISETEPAT
jgi:hypothetical protein